MARKKTPSHMMVNGVSIPVVHNPHLDTDTFGQWTKHTATGPIIEHSVTEPVEMLASTLLHEGLHALSDLNGIDLNETQVQMLESLLPKFIHDNLRMFNPILKVKQ